MKEGLVIKKVANMFSVLCGSEVFSCKPRGKHKEFGVYVGDYVKFNDDIIEEILPRKNFLIRPPLANLNNMFIVISKVPKPDFLLLDKLIVFCCLNSIKPYIVVNKIDIDLSIYDYIKKAYSDLIVIKTSTVDNDFIELKENLNGICAFAGQSAVGKSSLINALFGKNLMEVGELSKKIDVGKQTTRHTELFELKPGTFIADTAGFSKLDERLLDIDAEELFRYYPQYLKFAANCQYSSCTHTKEIKCGIKLAASQKKIDLERYYRYVKLFELLKQAKRRDL